MSTEDEEKPDAQPEGEAPPRKMKRRKASARPAGDDAVTRDGSVARAANPVALEDVAAANVRRSLLASGAAAALGVALVGTGPSDVGMWIALAGGVGLVVSIHRLGRLGPPGLPPATGGDPAAR